jgi:hypothetical protein
MDEKKSQRTSVVIPHKLIVSNHSKMAELSAIATLKAF